MKKILALLLAIVMVIGMAACNQQPADPTDAPTKGTEAPKATDAPETTEPGIDLSALPFVEPGSVKLVIGIQQNATVLDYHDNDLTKYFEEETGIDLDFMFFSTDSAEARQQLNLMVAGNEKLPDILIGILDTAMISELGNDGYLIDLTPYFENMWYYGKQYYDVWNDVEKALWHANVDPVSGERYAYTTISGGGSVDQAAYIGGLNKNWAAKLGMNHEDIDTVAEVKEYLQKALKEDPNGNGKADEIGLVFNQSAYRANAEMWIINAYVYCNDDSKFNVTDGEVWTPYDTEEYREALIEMNAWYKEGLISPLAYTNGGNNELKALIETPECYTLAAFGGHPTLVCNGDSEIGTEYANVKVLADETGKGGYAALRFEYSVTNKLFITSDCENPDIAWRLLDFMQCEMSQIRGRAGVEGVNWQFIDGEQEIDGVMTKLYDASGYPAGRAYIKDEWSTETKATWHGTPGSIGAKAWVEKGNPANPGYGGWRVLIDPIRRGAITYGNLYEMQAHEEPAEKFYGVLYNSEEQEIVTNYLKLYYDYVLVARAEFITGVKDPNNDADWNAYLAELEANHQSDLLEAGQAAYTRTYG